MDEAYYNSADELRNDLLTYRRKGKLLYEIEEKIWSMRDDSSTCGYGKTKVQSNIQRDLSDTVARIETFERKAEKIKGSIHYALKVVDDLWLNSLINSVCHRHIVNMYLTPAPKLPKIHSVTDKRCINRLFEAMRIMGIRLIEQKEPADNMPTG